MVALVLLAIFFRSLGREEDKAAKRSRPSPPLAGPQEPPLPRHGDAEGSKKRVAGAAMPHDAPVWAMGATIDFNDSFRRERARRGSSVQLSWEYTGRYADDPGSLRQKKTLEQRLPSEDWIRESYAGMLFDQIRADVQRDSQSGHWVCETKSSMGAMVLRREGTPVNLWLAAGFKGTENIPLTVSETAARLKDALVVRAYQARPGQVFRPRTEAPEQFQVGDGLYANRNRRWLPELGTHGPLFDGTDLATVARVEVFPPNEEAFGITDHNNHHSSTPARNITIPVGKLGDTFGLMVQVRIDVDWSRIRSYPELVALQAYLDVTSMNIPGLTGYAVPEPKEILLAETKTESDAYSAMLSRARGLEFAGDMDGARHVYEEVLARWHHANEVYERIERTYWAVPPSQAQLAVCLRAIEALKTPDYDDAVVWGSSMMEKPRERRIAEIDVVVARQNKFWTEQAAGIRCRIRSPDPQD